LYRARGKGEARNRQVKAGYVIQNDAVVLGNGGILENAQLCAVQIDIRTLENLSGIVGVSCYDVAATNCHQVGGNVAVIGAVKRILGQRPHHFGTEGAVAEERGGKTDGDDVTGTDALVKADGFSVNGQNGLVRTLKGDGELLIFGEEFSFVVG
jgi:hypothetical protein